jgi:hypothetical protein
MMAGRRRSLDDHDDSALIESIDSLQQEIRVLRDAVDELRIELQYVVRNPQEVGDIDPIERLRVTSLPLDPAASDFGERVNAVSEQAVAELRVSAETAKKQMTGPATNQRGLF